MLRGRVAVSAPALAQGRQQDPNQTTVIDSIAVLGNKRVPRATIIAQSAIPVGQGVSYRDIQRAVDALYATGQYRDVQALQGTVNGREVLRLSNDDETTTILLDPRTYTPIRWTTTAADGSKTTVRFDTYESLARTPATEPLLSLEAQHPNAKVDDSLADYRAAAGRLLGAHQS